MTTENTAATSTTSFNGLSAVKAKVLYKALTSSYNECDDKDERIILMALIRDVAGVYNFKLPWMK
jgi:hypothetical protein